MCTANRQPMIVCNYCVPSTLMVWMKENYYYCPRCDAYRFVVEGIVVKAK